MIDNKHNRMTFAESNRTSLTDLVVRMRSPSLPQLRVGKPLAEIIGSNEQRKVNQGIEHADSGAEAVACFQYPLAVDISPDHVCRLVDDRVVHDQDLLILQRHKGTDPQDKQNDHGRQDARERNLKHLLPAAGTVHFRRLIQGRIDIGNGRQINDGAPANPLPDGGRGIDGAEPFRQPHERNRLAAEVGDDMVDQAVHRQKIHQHPDNNDNGNEMGNIRNGLYGPLKDPMSHLVQHQGQHDGGGKYEDKIVRAEDNGIGNDPLKEKSVKKIAEMLKADPWAIPDAEPCGEVLERNLQAV